MDRSEIILAIVLILLGAVAVYAVATEKSHCQAVILSDIIEHQKFEAELMGKVNPDFLKELTKSK